MYNLLIGVTDGSVSADRIGEYTDDLLREYIKPDKQFDPARVVNLPTLLMPETGASKEEQVARIGRVEAITNSGAGTRTEFRFRFVPHPGYPPIPSEQIVSAATSLGITSTFEFTRTHWAVKDVDLYRALQESVVDVAPSPRVFRLPTELSREDDLVAVMMPFAPQFNPVYDALGAAATSAGMRFHRADDIWVNDHIMDDVISLIWRARVVIADFTDRNSNVFYETGIAHTLGRDVIQIAQSLSDVPFDLRGIRTVTYHPNGEGFAALSEQVAARLGALTRRG